MGSENNMVAVPEALLDRITRLAQVARSTHQIVTDAAGPQYHQYFVGLELATDELMAAWEIARLAQPDAQQGASSPASGARRCSVCTAVVASYPEGMCCHCQELPWPLAAATQPAVPQGIERLEQQKATAIDAACNLSLHVVEAHEAIRELMAALGNAYHPAHKKGRKVLLAATATPREGDRP